jgi:hypothetical protein
MGFNNVGSIANLNPGEEAWWWYTVGGNPGAQYASADIKTPNLGGVHLADQQQKMVDNNGNATYFVRITNQGPGSAFHNLQGGGFS